MRKTSTRGCLLLAIALAALLHAGPAFAGIWTAVPSGTSDEISAIDYVSPTRMVYATSTGQILEGAPGAGSVVNAFAGRQFFDIAVNPAGTVGLAVADSGKLYRSTAPGAWNQVSLSNTTYNSACSAAGAPYAKNKAPTANLLAVTWATDTVAYVVSAEKGQVLKTTDGGASWSEASQLADGTCRINADITDAGAVTGSANDVYFVDDSFGALWRTADGLATPASKRADTVNCYNIAIRLAVDPAAGNRAITAAACESYLHQGFTADSGTSAAYTKTTAGILRGTAAGPGVFLTVGDGGKIEQTLDGINVYQQPADGALAAKDWRSVDLADATHAAVGGTGGTLLVTDKANTPADVLAPAVQITGPAAAAVGTPVTFTAVATDNAGGSGVKGDGFEWTGTGLQPTTAGTATYTFANPGPVTISVKARDNAGNVSEVVTKTVSVGTATTPPPATLPKPTLAAASKPPLAGRAAKIVGKNVVFRVRGRLGLPKGLSRKAACKGTMSISVYKGKKRLKTKTAKVSSKCGYSTTVKVKRTKVGRKTKKLKLKVAFRGNAVLGKLSSTYKVRVKR